MRFLLIATFIFSTQIMARESFMDVWKKKNIAYKVRKGESILSILKRLGHISGQDSPRVKKHKVMQVVWRNGLYSQNVKAGDILWLTPGERKKKLHLLEESVREGLLKKLRHWDRF